MSQQFARMQSRCHAKAAFGSRADARREIDRLVRQGHAAPGTLRPYPCLCSNIHIGHIRCSTRDLRPARNLITSGSVLLVGQERA